MGQGRRLPPPRRPRRLRQRPAAGVHGVQGPDKDLRRAYEREPRRLQGHHPAPLPPQRLRRPRQRRRGQDRLARQPVEYFNEWKRLAEDEPGVVDMETLLKGVCAKGNFLDLSRTSSSSTIAPARRSRSSRATTSTSASTGPSRPCGTARSATASSACSGTPRARASPTRWCSSRRRSTASSAATSPSWSAPTARTSTTRSTTPSPAAGWSTTTRTSAAPARAEHCKELLGQHKAYVFTLIQKFNQDVNPESRTPTATTSSSSPTRPTAPSTAAWRSTCATPCRTPASSASPARRCSRRRDHAARLRRLRLDLRLPARRGGRRHRAALLRRARREAGLATNELNERIAEKLEELEIDDLDVARAPGEAS